MEACNVLNHKIRYTKFYLDTDGDINVEYDFPMSTPDEGIGEMAFEILVRMMQILDTEYGIFMKALYSDEDLNIQEYSISAELIQNLQRFRKMMETRMADADNSADEEADDFELGFDSVDSPNDIAC